jgi:hypothetical protein
MQAVQVLLDNNVREDRIIFLNLISAPEGIDAFVQRYPQIKIITGEIDGGLDEHKYIVPGVGDFGCRYGFNNGLKMRCGDQLINWRKIRQILWHRLKKMDGIQHSAIESYLVIIDASPL